MIWGLGIHSRLLIAAGVILFVGALSHAPAARAADLGGDCCADLEERVAELEATTVRKGNKKVSVTLYGKVNKAVLFWDDGAEKNIYAVDNNYESSRFGLKGSVKIKGDWSAGYRIEAENLSASSNAVNQLDDDDGTRSGGVLGNESRLLLLRHSYMYLDNKELGQVRWGLTPTPIYNITKDTNVTELEDTMHSDDRMNQGFFLRPKGGNTEKDLSTLKWQDISRCYGSSNAFVCSTRRNGVAYWTPEWSGFSASWGVFEDDIWGGALRYKNSFSPFGGGTGSVERRHMGGRRGLRLREIPRREYPELRRWPQRVQARHRRVGRLRIDQAQADWAVLHGRFQRFAEQRLEPRTRRRVRRQELA